MSNLNIDKTEGKTKKSNTMSRKTSITQNNNTNRMIDNILNINSSKKKMIINQTSSSKGRNLISIKAAVRNQKIE